MRIAIAILTFPAQIFYWLLCMRPARRKVVMLSRQGDRPSRDFLMLAEELQRRDPTISVVIRCRRLPDSLGGRLTYLGEIIAQISELASASVCVVDGYIIPVSLLTHRRELTVVQMWHALGAIKRFGYQSVGRPGGRSRSLADALRMHRNYDLVLCGGQGSVAAFAEAFGVSPESVLPLGLPRVDYLLAHKSPRPLSPSAVSLCKRHSRLLDTKRTRILYAPTFRRGGESDFSQVVAAFEDERFTLIVKPHSLETGAANAEHVVDASGVDILDLLPLADVVVTDYSAVAFEAAVIDKPLYFYVRDIDEYAEHHGLNIDPREEMAAVTFRDVHELAGHAGRQDYTVEVLRAFKDRYVSAAGGGCTRAIADLVVDHLPHP